MRYIRLIRKSTYQRLFPGRLPRRAMAFPPIFASARVLETSLVGRCPSDKATQPCLAFVEAAPPAREVAMAIVPRRLAYHLQRGLRRRKGGHRTRETGMPRRIEQDRHAGLRRREHRRLPVRQPFDFGDAVAEPEFLDVVEKI